MTSKIVRTFQQWQEEGRYVKKGARPFHFDNGEPLFRFEDTAEIRQSPYREYPHYRGNFDSSDYAEQNEPQYGYRSIWLGNCHY